MKSLSSLIAAVTVLIGTSSLAEEATLVGMLEQQASCGKEAVTAVRPLFAKQGQSWISLATPDLAAGYDLTDREWTIAFDGRALGTVDTRYPSEGAGYARTYDRDFRLTIAEDASLPAIANSRREFIGWCNLPEMRPLVVNSRPNADDPDRWKPFVVGRGYVELLFDAYFRALGEIPVCFNRPESHAFTADDLELVKAYRDVAGRQLVSLRLRSGGEGCEADPTVQLIVWFAITESVHHIGNNLELIDAGDYDGDGKSEIVFWHASYNRDGYSLLLDDLSRRVDFIWSYH